MQERVATLEARLDNIDKVLEKITHLVDKHDVACEVNAPKAESAHNGVINMSKQLGVVSEALGTLVKNFDAVLLRNIEADKKTDKILLELAELRGAGKVLAWGSRILIGASLLGAFSFILWSTNEILKLKHTANIKSSSEKAINRDVIKKDKKNATDS